jgi:glycosyltransferase involved in cell wall biosynthesis
VSEEERIRFEEQLAEMELGDRVTLLGELIGESKWEAFQRADFFFFPSFYESENFPLVLIEALGSGLPVVATRWRGIPEVVDEGLNAILCESGAIDELADAITRLCTSPEMKKSMMEAARSAYLAQYTREIYCDNMECAMVNALKSGEGCRL